MSYKDDYKDFLYYYLSVWTQELQEGCVTRHAYDVLPIYYSGLKRIDGVNFVVDGSYQFYDSCFLKDELLKIAGRINKAMCQTKWQSASYLKLQKDIFFAFYAIRKLIETDQITNGTRNYTAKLHVFKAKAKSINKNNQFCLERCYDFSRRKTETLRISDICNQIIHSYIFVPCRFAGGKHPMHSVLFASDKKKNECLYELELIYISGVCRRVGHDYSKEKLRFPDGTSQVNVYR